MTPRRPADTRPVLLAAQIVRRPRTDPYGADRKRIHERPVATRNGIPERRYRYQGTGQSMSSAEAWYWLTVINR